MRVGTTNEGTGRLISDANSLDGLLRSFGPVPKSRRRWNFTLRLALLSGEELADWEGRLKRYYFSCGCMEGSVASLAAIVAYGIYIWLRPGGLYIHWTDGLSVLLLFMVAGLIGKIMGLAYGRRRLAQTVSELKSLLHDRANDRGARGGVTC